MTKNINKFYINKQTGVKYFAERYVTEYASNQPYIIFYPINNNEVDFDNPIILSEKDFFNQFRLEICDLKIGDKVFVTEKHLLKIIRRINLPSFEANDYTVWDVNQIREVI